MKKILIRYIVVAFCTTLLSINANAQSLGLNNATPDGSSIIDMTATDRGVLVPRMLQAERNAIVNPATSLLIFQTDVIPGFYYNAGTPGAPNWVPFLSNAAAGPSGWDILGNTGTTAGTNFLGTTDAVDFVVKTAGTERLRVYNGNGLLIAPLAAASSTALDIGALSGATTNLGINIGAISGAGTAAGITTGAISATGATAHQLNLGDISGANVTSQTGIKTGNISGGTLDAIGLNLGTITGATNANMAINTGAITSTGALNSYGINVGAISGTGTNNYGINVNALTSDGVSTGINVAGLSGVGTTNTGLSIGTIVGGATNNFGLKVSGTAAAANNYGVYVDAPAKNYFAGQVGMGTLATSPDANALLDMVATDKGVLVPRMTTVQRTAIAPATANGLLVFDTDLRTFYYYDLPATTWRPLLSSINTTSIGWAVDGNNGIVEGTHFIGTIGSVDVTVRAANVERFRVNFDDGPEVAPMANALNTSPTGLKIGALTGNATNTGLNIGALTGATNLGITIGNLSGTTANTGLNIGTIGGTGTGTGISAGAISSTGANNYGINFGNLSGGTTSNNGINIGTITSAGASNASGFIVGNLSSAAASTGLNIGTLTGATNLGVTIGNLNGTTANTGLKIGTISGTGTGTGISGGAISSTGANNYGINFGNLSGGTTSNNGINIGTITSAGASNASGFIVGNLSSAAASTGLNIGTLTGATNLGVTIGNLSGTTANTGLNIGTIGGTGTGTGISVGAISTTGATNLGINLGNISAGTSSNRGINIGTITGAAAATINGGLQIGAISGAAATATNTGISIAAVSGGSLNAGLKISGTSAASAANYGLYVDAPAHNYIEGQVGIATSTVNAITGVKLDVRGTIVGAIPVTSSDYAQYKNDDDKFAGALIGLVPSTNVVSVRFTTSNQTAVASLASTAFWDAWVSFSAPVAAGPIYVMSLSINILSYKDNADKYTGSMTARMSDGTVYVRTTSSAAITYANLKLPAQWSAWTSFGSPGM